KTRREGTRMNAAKYNVVVPVDPVHWSQRKEAEVVADWLEPLANHPRVNSVIFAGAVKPFAHRNINTKLRFVPGRIAELELLLEQGSQQEIEAVIRLNHYSKLRFPLLPSLIDATIDGYEKLSRGGYFQLDLSDLPYPHLAPEVLGNAALLFYRNHKDVP